VADGFYAQAPANLGPLMAQTARFFGWSKSEVEDLTPAELYEWVGYANQMIKKAK
jgi:hypothetical protein